MRSCSPLTLLLAAGLSHVEAVRFLGRVNPATRGLTWPGTGVSFAFTGSSASIGLEAVTGTNSVELRVDGQATVIANVNGTSISTPTGLAHGNHTVSIRKRSEALYGSIFIGNITTDGTLGPDTYSPRKLQVIGDSITVGYGLDGLLPCTNSAALEDNPKTYVALAADSLGADIDIIAWSGIGLIRNYVSPNDTSPNMQDRWTRYGAQDPVHSYTFPAADTPDAVVINLGTNDFSYQAGVRGPLSATEYTRQMVGFVKKIQTHYPHAVFFLLNSPMLNDAYPSEADAQKTTQTNALKAAIARLGNGTRALLVDWPSQGSEDLGCDYHPNAATNRAEAGVLADAIRKELKW
jgi:lysophospholipase L1-like esterase